MGCCTEASTSRLYEPYRRKGTTVLLTVGEFWNGVDLLDVVEEKAPEGSPLWVATVPVDDGIDWREIFFHAVSFNEAHKAAATAFGRNSGFSLDLA